MALEGKKSIDKWFPVLLIDDTDFKTRIAGKVFGDIVVKYQYEGATSQSTATILTANWKEAGNGEYSVQIGNPEFANEGKYQVSVAVAGCLTYDFIVEVTDNTNAEMQNVINNINTNNPIAPTHVPY